MPDTKTTIGHKLLEPDTCCTNRYHSMHIDCYGICSNCDWKCTCGSSIMWLDFTDPACAASDWDLSYADADISYNPNQGITRRLTR